jgi:hypothetical protein
VTPDELADRLEAAAKRLGPEVARATLHSGQLLRALIQSNATGRPGPNYITGDYHGSWQVAPEQLPYGANVVVGTDRPQGRRLEFGFVGADSLGRMYNQPPFPHAGPAVEELSKNYPEQILRAVGEALS